MKADFTIHSAPVSIGFTCPQCGGEVSIPWNSIDRPEAWSDAWTEVQCPECGAAVELDAWEYD